MMLQNFGSVGGITKMHHVYDDKTGSPSGKKSFLEKTLDPCLMFRVTLSPKMEKEGRLAEMLSLTAVHTPCHTLLTAHGLVLVEKTKKETTGKREGKSKETNGKGKGKSKEPGKEKKGKSKETNGKRKGKSKEQQEVEESDDDFERDGFEKVDWKPPGSKKKTTGKGKGS